MSICTVCDQPSYNSIKLPKYVRDRRAAYVEDVCRILIESRMGPAAVWVEREEPSSPVPDPLAADAPLLDFRRRFFSWAGEAMSAFRELGSRLGLSRFGLKFWSFARERLRGLIVFPSSLTHRISASCEPRGSPRSCTVRNAIIGVQGGKVWDATYTNTPRHTQMRTSKKLRLAALFAGKLACPVRGPLICG
jgi:hypothetical protein